MNGATLVGFVDQPLILQKARILVHFHAAPGEASEPQEAAFTLWLPPGAALLDQGGFAAHIH